MKHSMVEYRSKDIVFTTPVFAKYMSRDRFKLLLKYLHFADNTTLGLSDPLSKIWPVFTALKSKMKNLFLPIQNLILEKYGSVKSGVRDRAASQPHGPASLAAPNYKAHHYIKGMPPPEVPGSTRKHRVKGHCRC
ncbi:putative PiggyBac transposable element-derived protein 4-like 25, partial [Homarus americanus]